MGGNSYMLLPAASLLVLIITPLFLNQAKASTSIDDQWLQKVRLPNEKVAKIEFYTNPSEILPVANAGNLTVPPPNFGLVGVADFRLTAGPNLTASALVGRGQGFVTSSSMTEFSFFTALNILFQAGQYKDSTLTFIGYDPTGPDSRELNVIGGTGEFRMARGFVNFSSYSRNPTNNYTNVLRFSVTVLHY